MTRFALVTGASRGLGRATAVHLSRKGYCVIGLARSAEALAHLRGELAGDGHKVIAIDLATPAGAATAISRITEICGSHGLSAFVQCAAATPDPEAEATLGDTSLEAIEDHLMVTARAGMLLLRGLRETLAKAAPAKCICISSDWTIEGNNGPPVFSAAKRFVGDVWRHARVEYLRHGIVLAVVVPGNIATYDADWVEAKWLLDDPIADIQAELGNSRIALTDMMKAFDLILDAELAAVAEIKLFPLDPDYTA